MNILDYNFIFKPYIGAEPILFGMTSEEVLTLFNTIPRIKTNYLGERDEDRDGIAIRYSKDKNTVVEIAFLPNSKLIFNGQQLFGIDAVKDPIKYLMNYDKSPKETDGFVVFLELGLTITGFHDGNIEQRAITLFSKGRWDKYLNDMVLLKF